MSEQWHRRAFDHASRALALTVTVVLFLVALLSNAAPVMNRHVAVGTVPMVSAQPEDLNLMALVEGPLLLGATQVALEEDPDNGEETERRLKVFLTSQQGFGALHYRLLSFQGHGSDSPARVLRSQAPDPRPPRA